MRIWTERFDALAGLASFAQMHPAAGAVTSFTGQVRGEPEVHALEITHYPLLTLPGMQNMAAEAERRWQTSGLLVWHRVGIMGPREPIVFVAAAARHRRAAFDAVDFVMDHLKAKAFFWKREQRADGWHWINPRSEDYDDLARWRQAHP